MPGEEKVRFGADGTIGHVRAASRWRESRTKHPDSAGQDGFLQHLDRQRQGHRVHLGGSNRSRRGDFPQKQGRCSHAGGCPRRVQQLPDEEGHSRNSDNRRSAPCGRQR
uniref:(northern house mosquito) hypothetical protein n=1 Tax=Culex pipiens TaxID=7175 RepID=A0A8D8FLM2_CULPI